MEDTPPLKVHAGFLDELKKIEDAAAKAQNVLDREAAADQDIQFAINIVERFLRRRGRICYGGQAINAHLPRVMKFYDPETSVPDYDFLTPNADADIKEIVADFRAEGYRNISVRMGMHEGTTKIYVEYIPVADVTEIHEGLYKILSKKSVKIDGIHYIDVNTLRMMMYLELSRPRGEVGRWSKVYERLSLLNAARPIHTGHCATDLGLGTPEGRYAIDGDDFNKMVYFLMENKRILVGAAAVDYYRKLEGKKRAHVAHWLFSRKKPVIFYSPNIRADLDELNGRLNGAKKMHIEVIESVGEFIPKVGLLYVGGTAAAGPRRLVAAAVQQTACHAYITAAVNFHGDEKILRIGSMDTLATLYLSLMLSPVLEKKLRAPLLCMAQAVVEMGMRIRRHGSKTSRVPFISLRCEGHQPRLQSLLREKVERIRRAKEEGTSSRRSNSRKSFKKTKKRHAS